MEANKKKLAEKVSVLYYEKNKGQNEIADELNISRSYVSQLITYAREIGIVKITVNIDEFDARMIRREVEFKSRFSCLKQVYIMNSPSEEFTSDNLGKFASPYITELINNANVIGINLGQSVEKTIDSLDSSDFCDTSDKKVVQIMGGFGSSKIVSTAHPNELVKKLGNILSCTCYFLNCPAIIEQAELRLALLKENSIGQVVDMWNQVDLALMGIGVSDCRSKLYSLLNSESLNQLKNSGVCGELAVNFLDEEGKYIPLLEENKISISLDNLSKVKKKVVICYGAFKNKVILSALRAKMIDVLITDSITIDAVESLIAH